MSVYGRLESRNGLNVRSTRVINNSGDLRSSIWGLGAHAVRDGAEKSRAALHPDGEIKAETRLENAYSNYTIGDVNRLAFNPSVDLENPDGLVKHVGGLATQNAGQVNVQNFSNVGDFASINEGDTFKLNGSIQSTDIQQWATRQDGEDIRVGKIGFGHGNYIRNNYHAVTSHLEFYTKDANNDPRFQFFIKGPNDKNKINTLQVDRNTVLARGNVDAPDGYTVNGVEAIDENAYLQSGVYNRSATYIAHRADRANRGLQSDGFIKKDVPAGVNLRSGVGIHGSIVAGDIGEWATRTDGDNIKVNRLRLQNRTYIDSVYQNLTTQIRFHSADNNSEPEFHFLTKVGNNKEKEIAHIDKGKLSTHGKLESKNGLDVEGKRVVDTTGDIASNVRLNGSYNNMKVKQIRAFALLDKITDVNSTTYIGNEAIVTDLIAADAVTADKILVQDLFALDATIGNFQIESSLIQSIGPDGYGMQLLANNKPGIHLIGQGNNELFIGGEYSYDNFKHDTRNLGLVNDSSSHSDATNHSDSEVNGPSHDDTSIPASWQGRLLKYSVSMSLSAQASVHLQVGNPGIQGTASAEALIKVQILDSGGSVLYEDSIHKTIHNINGDGRANSYGTENTFYANIPNGAATIRVRSYTRASCQSRQYSGGWTSSDASAIIDDSTAVIQTVTDYVSPHGFNMSSNDGKHRIYGNRDDGQLRANKFYLQAEDNNGDCFLKMVGNNLNVYNENGGFVKTLVPDVNVN